MLGFRANRVSRRASAELRRNTNAGFGPPWRPTGQQDRAFAEIARVLRPGGTFAGTESVGTGWLFRLIHVGDTLNVVAGPAAGAPRGRRARGGRGQARQAVVPLEGGEALSETPFFGAAATYRSAPSPTPIGWRALVAGAGGGAAADAAAPHRWLVVVSLADLDLLCVDRSRALPREGRSGTAEQHGGHRVGARVHIRVSRVRP